MWALLQALAIGFVAAVLFVAVEKIEPNRPYAYLFMFLILAVGMLAIVDQLCPEPEDRYIPFEFLHSLRRTNAPIAASKFCSRPHPAWPSLPMTPLPTRANN